ncbi:MAG TPA: hypothetical protein VNQ73_22475 [Ilumatobacter sp.]|nr:hypothetical protein [Ilumatobacter sp.]
MSDRPCVALCSGKDCRKRAEYRDLRTAVAEVASVEPVRCLDLCDSPVAVVRPGTPDAVVFDKLRTSKQHRDLAAFVAGAAPSARLAERQVTGKSRRKVLAKLAGHRKRR